MKKSEVQVGATYLMNHSSGRVQVRILRDGGRDMLHWVAINLKTGREIEIKSAQKLLGRVD